MNEEKIYYTVDVWYKDNGFAESNGNFKNKDEVESFLKNNLDNIKAHAKLINSDIDIEIKEFSGLDEENDSCSYDNIEIISFKVGEC